MGGYFVCTFNALTLWADKNPQRVRAKFRDTHFQQFSLMLSLTAMR